MTTTPLSTTCRFAGLTIEYDARVITPRPWTQTQSDWAVELLRGAPAGPVLELCAGAGHIGLATAVGSGRPLVQVEADEVAAGYARANAARAGRAGSTDVRHGRLQDVLHAGERFPLVVADPPYLPSAHVARWPEDPVLAIDGGNDGLDVTRAVLVVAADHLVPGGTLLLQVAGPGQARQVLALPEAAAFALDAAETRAVDAERAVLRLDLG